MATIDFITMKDLQHKADVLTMMHGLYSEDEAASPVDRSRFPLTIDFFLANPSRGRIILFEEGISLRGYALLVPFWSNEFGAPRGGRGRIVCHTRGSQPRYRQELLPVSGRTEAIRRCRFGLGSKPRQYWCAPPVSVAGFLLPE